MEPTTPTGSRRMRLVWPARYSPAARPCGARHTPAKKRNTSAIDGISSASMAASGLPVLRDSSAAYASPSASMCSATRSSSAARSFGGVRAQPPKAASAALTAASTCATEAAGTAAICSPLAAFTTGSAAASPLTSRPPINICVCIAPSPPVACRPRPQRYIITPIILPPARACTPRIPMNSDVIITCAITGDDTKVTKSPHCPVTAEQIANSALEAARAGAAIVHIHVRDPETGEFSMATRHYREVVKLIRDSNQEVIVNLTCGMGGYICVGDNGLEDTPAPGSDFCSQEQRMRHVIELCREGLYRPDIATLDCGSLNFGDRNRAYVSTP